MSDTSEPKTRRKPHWFLRVLRALGVLSLLGIASYFVADQIAYRNYQAQLERFREQFGKVTYEEFIPARPPADEDAGRVYRYAVGIMAEVEAIHGDWSPYHALTEGATAFERRGGGGDPLPTDDEIDALVREKMAAMSEMFRVLEEARALDRGSILDDYDVGQLLKPLTEARHLANVIAAKAFLEARAGNLAGACGWLESGLHLASTLNGDPTILVQMVRVALVEIALDAAEEVFNTTDEPLPLSARFWVLVDGAADTQVFLNGLASEMGYSASVDMPGPRLWRSLTQARMLEFFLELASILPSAPSADRVARIDALNKRVESLSAVYILVKMTAPNLLRSGLTYDRLATRCTLLRVAAALREYKAAHGAYPESLDAVAPAISGAVPTDSFSGAPFEYHVEANGFLLTSAGAGSTGPGVGRERGEATWNATR